MDRQDHRREILLNGGRTGPESGSLTLIFNIRTLCRMSLANPLADDSASTGLDRLPIGRRASIERVHGDAEMRRRLLEMGLCTGVEIEVLRRAPLGDPIELRVRGYLLSIRIEQARFVIVTPAQAAAA